MLGTDRVARFPAIINKLTPRQLWPKCHHIRSGRTNNDSACWKKLVSSCWFSVAGHQFIVRWLCALFCLANSLTYLLRFSIFVSYFIFKKDLLLHTAGLWGLLDRAHSTSALRCGHQGHCWPAQFNSLKKCTVSLCNTQLHNAFVNLRDFIVLHAPPSGVIYIHKGARYRLRYSTLLFCFSSSSYSASAGSTLQESRSLPSSQSFHLLHQPRRNPPEQLPYIPIPSYPLALNIPQTEVLCTQWHPSVSKPSASASQPAC